VIKILIGNKIDLEDERKVKKSVGEQFAKDNGMLFLECSSKTKIGIYQAFEEVVQKILDTDELLENTSKININLEEDKKTDDEQCCSWF
jgi:Ras-related protein Rab-18